MECDLRDIQSVRALLVHITQLHLPSFVLHHRYEYQREIQYTEEYGEVLLEEYVRLLECCGSN